MLVKGRPTLEYLSLRNKSFRETVIDKIIFDGRSDKRIDDADEEKYVECARVYFNSHTIVQNRETARLLGIESATIASKSVLTDKLVDYVWGLQYFDSGKQVLESPDLKRFTFEDEIKELEIISKGEFLSGEIVNGIVELLDDGNAILRTVLTQKSPTDTVIFRRLVNIYSLKDGYEVEVRAHYSEKARCLVAHCIDQVNGCKPNDEVNEPNPIEPNERVKITAKGFGNAVNLITPISLGQTLVVSYLGKMEKNYAFSELSQALKSGGSFDEIYPVLFGESEENLSIARNTLGEDTIVYSRAGDGALREWLLKMLTAYSVVASKYARKIVVVISDLDGAVCGNADLAEQIVALSRAYDNGGSLTVVAFVDRENATYGRIKRLPSAELRVRFYPYDRTYTVDLPSSYSFGKAKITLDEQKVRKYLYENDESNGARQIIKRVDSALNYDAEIKLIADEL